MLGSCTDGGQLHELSKLAETGELVVPVDRALPLGEARAAQELIEAGRVTGKLRVLTVERLSG